MIERIDVNPLWVTKNEHSLQPTELLHMNPLIPKDTHHQFSFLVLSNNMFVLLEQEGYCTFRSTNYNSYYFLNTYENSHTFESQNITFTGIECIK